MAQAME